VAPQKKKELDLFLSVWISHLKERPTYVTDKSKHGCYVTGHATSHSEKSSLFKSPAAQSLESPLFHSARMRSSIESMITFPGCSSITKITQTLLPYQECYHYIKILNVWVCVCDRSGRKFRGWDCTVVH